MTSFCEQTPPPGLLRWVECAWAMESPLSVEEYRVPPDGCLDILYTRGAGLHAVGTMTTEQGFRLPARTVTAGVRFRPGMAAAFLGVPPGELTDRQVGLDDLWQGRTGELRRRLDNARSIQECMAMLLGHLRTPPREPGTVERAIEAITLAKGDADVDQVAGEANLSARQFRRRCLDASGLTPKRLCRVLRFRHARQLATAAEHPDWSGIAVEAGYFDQSHLIRDWSEFTGRTPHAGAAQAR